MKNTPLSIAFVCLGNICRSPTAEAIMKDILVREGNNDIEVSSYASTAWEEGNSPDRRAVEEGRRRGIEITGRSTVLTKEIAEQLDLILVMEKANYRYVVDIVENDRPERVRYLASFEPGSVRDAEIIDPYYGSSRGFAECFEHIARCCEGVYIHTQQTN